MRKEELPVHANEFFPHFRSKSTASKEGCRKTRAIPRCGVGAAIAAVGVVRHISKNADNKKFPLEAVEKQKMIAKIVGTSALAPGVALPPPSVESSVVRKSA